LWNIFSLKVAFPEVNKSSLHFLVFHCFSSYWDNLCYLLDQQLLDIYHLCHKHHLRQYLAKDNLRFLWDLQQLDICHLYQLLHLHQHQDNLQQPATSGQASSLSATPSPSVSGQPFNAAKPATSGQSSLSWIPSPSVSGQPLNSFKPATSGQASSLSYIPSPSVSFPPNLKTRPAVC
jgi:hypothetical protein